ncbi:MAG: transcriptional regulator FtsR [Actinomycetota bacterium]
MAEAARKYLSIGEVLVSLKAEFPDVTISKIRFLESEGLIAPERTSSGYRKFYEQDVDRLRMILKLQRDEYLPLKVIRDRLEEGTEAELDAAAVAPMVPTGESAVAQAEEELDEPMLPGQLTAEELATAAGVDAEMIEALASFSILRPRQIDGERKFGGEDLLILRIVKSFFKYGIEPRHLTMYRHFADREAAFFQQIVTPMLRQRNPDARRTAAESLAELARASRRLKQALLRANIRDYLPG